MTLEEFVFLVRNMRDAQNMYFKTRSKQWLESAKELERQVDAVVVSAPPQRLFEKDGTPRF